MATLLHEAIREIVKRPILNYRSVETGEIHFGFPLRFEDADVVPLKTNEDGELVGCDEDECTWWSNYLSVSADPNYIGESEVEVIKGTIPALLRCGCGCEFYLTGNSYGATNCPECGQWYNLWGDALLPPGMWYEI